MAIGFVALAVACGADPDRRAASTAAERRASAADEWTASTTSSLPPSSTTVAPSTTTPPIPQPGPLAKPGQLDGPFAVTRVVDGDTIKVSNGETLRLIGVDTPETVDPRKPVQCFGRESSLVAHALLDGTQVELEYDPTQGRLDKYGRTLAYVWMADGRLYNETIIADGFAHEYTYAIPYRYQHAFIAAERSARDAGRGLWSAAACAGDTTKPAATPPALGPVRPGCDASYPDTCIPPSPPDLDCGDVPARGFRVIGADPHRFDADHDGLGCE